MKTISFIFMVAGICAYAENTLDINLDLGKSRPTGFEVQQYWLFAVGYLQLGGCVTNGLKGARIIK